MKDEQDLTELLYLIYMAGFSHGSNEGPFPKTGCLEAFGRLVKDESPRQDNTSYVVKDRIQKLNDLIDGKS